jgi:hypothetical protein
MSRAPNDRPYLDDRAETDAAVPPQIGNSGNHFSSSCTGQPKRARVRIRVHFTEESDCPLARERRWARFDRKVPLSHQRRPGTYFPLLRC